MPRPLLTGAAATAIAACVLVLPGLALSGSATASGSAQQPSGSSPVSVAITSLSPSYAQPGKPVTVSGTLTNTSPDAMSGLSVQILSSSAAFSNRSELQEYADGDFSDGESAITDAGPNLPGTVSAHATVSWSAQLSPADLPSAGSIGVYPLAAQAYSADFTPLSISRTFLPFWPNDKAQNPSVQQVAWIWPLIDQPRQAQCPGLLNDDLAASLATGGRLSGLLAAGSQYGSRAHLTWAIDPALLETAKTMTTPYQVDNAQCKATAHPASQAATTWLQQLKTATDGQPVFVTPYDDADIAALTRDNMTADLARAFTQGRAVASQVLDRNFTSGLGGATATMNGTAWPADGIANYAVLENLAASDKINTVVLDSSTMPPTVTQTFTPSAQTVTADGEGPDMNVLLSDDTITQILGTADTQSSSPSSDFSVAQRYLAETAMITAEAPNLARSIVVAPPAMWDPSQKLATQLLQDTVSAPWLQPVSLSELASSDKNATGQVPRQEPPTATSGAALPPTLLAQAAQLDQQATLLQSLQTTPDPVYDNALDNAVMAVESSAWRGGGSALAAGQALAAQATAYLSGQEGKLTIIGAPRVTLGGLTGTVPVSVANGLGFPVRVGLRADPSGRVTVREPHRTIVVPAGQQEIIKLQVTADAVGSTTLHLNLVNQAGAALPARGSVIIQATHYGDLALVIIGVALGIFLLTAAARAFRQGPRAAGASGPAPPAPAGHGPERSGGGPQPHEAEPDQRGLRDGPDAADTVMSDDRGTGQVSVPTGDSDRAEVTDDYAWAPGQAEPR